MEEDLGDGTLIHQSLEWTETLRQAEAVADQFGWTYSCRSLDLWHIAAALEIRAATFVTFDKDQFTLANAAGLRAVIPA